MLDYNQLFELPLFELTQDEKARLYAEWLQALSAYHAERCLEYRRLLQAFGSDFALPVRLFKEIDRKSVV